MTRVLVAEWVSETRGFGHRCHKSRLNAKVKQGFSSFFAIFDAFPKWSPSKALRNFEKFVKYGKKLAKYEGKPAIFDLPSNLQPIFRLIPWHMYVPENRISGTHSPSLPSNYLYLPSILFKKYIFFLFYDTYKWNTCGR